MGGEEAQSKWIVYIASKEIPGFRTLEFIEHSQEFVDEYSTAVVQMLCVYSVLMLADHHSANMGFDSSQKPFIVDFFVCGHPLKSVKDIYDSVPLTYKFK